MKKCWIPILAGIFLIPEIAGAITLPSPPTIGGAGGSSNIWEYIKTSIVVIAGVVLVGLIVVYVVSGGGGLLRALSKARERGEWGEFFTYFTSLIIVGVVLFFLVYFANEEYLKLV